MKYSKQACRSARPPKGRRGRVGRNIPYKEKVIKLLEIVYKEPIEYEVRKNKIPYEQKKER